jgi:hypothetical protein
MPPEMLEEADRPRLNTRGTTHHQKEVAMNRLRYAAKTTRLALALTSASLISPALAQGARETAVPAPMVEIQIPATVGTGIIEGEEGAALMGVLPFHTQIRMKLWNGVLVGVNRTRVQLHRDASRHVRTITIEAQPEGSVEVMVPAGMRWEMRGIPQADMSFSNGCLTLSTKDGSTLLFADGLRFVSGRAELEFQNNRPNDEHTITVSLPGQTKEASR